MPTQMPLSASSKDEVYLWGKDRASLADLLFQYMDSKKTPLNIGLNEFDVTVPFDDRCLYFLSSDKLISLKVDFSATVELANYRFPIKYMSYIQQGWELPLAWITEAKGIIKGTEVVVKGLVRPDEGGNYRYSIVEITPGYKIKEISPL